MKSKKWHSWVAGVFAASAIWMTSGVVMAKKEEAKLGPVPIVVVESKYPRAAAMEGIEGWVKLKLNVDSYGMPYEVQVIDALPKGTFDDDAVTAMRQWKFKPDGVQTGIIYTLEYKMPDNWEEIKKTTNSKK